MPVMKQRLPMWMVANGEVTSITRRAPDPGARRPTVRRRA